MKPRILKKREAISRNDERFIRWVSDMRLYLLEAELGREPLAEIARFFKRKMLKEKNTTFKVTKMAAYVNESINRRV